MKECPKCGMKEIDITVERVLPENNGIDMNKAVCPCGWSGVACELVAGGTFVPVQVVSEETKEIEPSSVTSPVPVDALYVEDPVEIIQPTKKKASK